MLYGNLMKLKHETNGSLMKIDPSHTAVPIKFTFTIPVGEFSMVFLNSACRFSQGIDIHFLHCRQKISESLHKKFSRSRLEQIQQYAKKSHCICSSRDRLRFLCRDSEIFLATVQEMDVNS